MSSSLYCCCFFGNFMFYNVIWVFNSLHCFTSNNIYGYSTIRLDRHYWSVLNRGTVVNGSNNNHIIQIQIFYQIKQSPQISSSHISNQHSTTNRLRLFDSAF